MLRLAHSDKVSHILSFMPSTLTIFTYRHHARTHTNAWHMHDCVMSMWMTYCIIHAYITSFVPRPHPQEGKTGLVNMDTIFGPGKRIEHSNQIAALAQS